MSMTPYSVIPCHVRLSSPVMPGPVFCCASDGSAALTAPSNSKADHPLTGNRETLVAGTLGRSERDSQDDSPSVAQCETAAASVLITECESVRARSVRHEGALDSASGTGEPTIPRASVRPRATP